VLDFFDVGGADAADGDFDQQFVCANARDGDGFEAEVVNAAINDGAHGFGDVKHARFLAQRREDAKPQRTGFLCAIKSVQLGVEINGGGTPALPGRND
jgi:hypothetical protein